MNPNTLRKRYKELSRVEQGILKLMAVAGEPLDNYLLVSLLRRFNVKTSLGKPYIVDDLAPNRQALDDAGWLDFEQPDQWALRVAFRPFGWRMAVIDPMYKAYLVAIRSELPVRNVHNQLRNFEALVRELCVSFYEGDLTRIEELSTLAENAYPDQWAHFDLIDSVFGDFDDHWLKTFPAPMQHFILERFVERALCRLEPLEPYLAYLAKQGNPARKVPALLVGLCLQGHWEEAVRHLGTAHDPALDGWRGVVAFISGEQREALLAFSEGKTRTGGGGYGDFRAVFHLLCALSQITTGNVVLPAVAPANAYRNMVAYLKAAWQVQQNELQTATQTLGALPESPLDWLFFGFANFWSDFSFGNFELERLREACQGAQQNGYRWVAMQLADLLSAVEAPIAEGEQNQKDLAAQLHGELSAASLCELLPRKPAWQRALEALEQMEPPAENDQEEQHISRLSWLVDFEQRQVQPVEQTLLRNGWSKGKKVSLKRLKTGDVDGMTPQDRKAATAILNHNDGYPGADYRFDFNRLMLALAGHPLLFRLDNPALPVELLRQELRLYVDKSDDGFLLQFSHPFENEDPQLVRETPTRYLLLQPSAAQVAIHRRLSFGKLQVPKTGRKVLLRTIHHISPLAVIQSDIEDADSAVPRIEGDPTPRVQLLLLGDSYKLELFVKPFTDVPPYAKPGKGHPILMAEVNGLPLKAVRNLEEEEAQAHQLEQACPTLVQFPSENREWHLPDTDSCLQVLLELEPLRSDGKLVLEFPNGQQMRLKSRVDLSQLSLRIQRHHDWFEVEGAVTLDDGEVIQMKQLLERMRHTGNRFVELTDGQFVALTEQLRSKLNDLDALLNEQDGAWVIHPLAGLAFEELTMEMPSVVTDADWAERLRRFKSIDDYQAQLPEGFTATLRPYQMEGFQWLMRMAQWGAGACLADDMGLGKTIQALAMLVSRAAEGPALVVAPASVVRNWYHEMNRFAPALKPVIFGDDDRSETLRQLGPGQVLLSSYGLMQQEVQRLSDQTFTTVVLDEAQAIKNRATKRSKAAMMLRADMRLIATGTPIENHLGELWNLFQFLNPGLLGSYESFAEKFAVPITRDEDTYRLGQLRRLLRPFILRRRKDDVLKELPPKTEVTLEVTLSNEERVFYEALRQQALENIAKDAGNFKQKRFRILAELMRLRQAACHPRLVLPDSALPSAKLSLFEQIVEELLDEGHKALVFSQFVQHLKIVEAWVKSRGISYQYLDGSTSMTLRDRSIREFQAGKGDLFLISLRAGGFGLNLTAADYVLHLDPWWNPAVEDQASDRAHRIGQERPVTVYRFVSANTIEEKIVKLHAEKRELADSLLEGTESAGQLNIEDMIALLEER